MFEGKADWSKITELKQALRIPVIGSGDLFSGRGRCRHAESDRLRRRHDRQGSARQSLDFQGSAGSRWPAGSPSPTPTSVLSGCCRHLELFTELAGERVALLEMRKHLSWYARGLPGAAQFRAQVNRLQNKEQLIWRCRIFQSGTRCYETCKPTYFTPMSSTASETGS